MSWKMLTERKTAIDVVKSAIEAHRGLVVQGARRFLAPGLRPGEQMPDLDFLMTLFERALDHLLARLERAETALDLRRRREKALRREHRRLVKVLYARVVEVRNADGPTTFRGSDLGPSDASARPESGRWAYGGSSSPVGEILPAADIALVAGGRRSVAHPPSGGLRGASGSPLPPMSEIRQGRWSYFCAGS